MKQFNLEHRKWEDYQDTLFCNKDCALVIKGPMLINSSELRAAGFKLKEVLSAAIEEVARGGMRTRGTGLRSLEGMGPKRLSVDDDTEFRSRCE